MPPVEEGGGAPNNQELAATITFLRGTLDIDKIIINAINDHNNLTWNTEDVDKSSVRRFFIRHIPDIRKNDKSVAFNSGPNGGNWFRMPHYRLLNYSPNQIGWAASHKQSRLDNLIFPTHIRKLISEICLWKNNRSWYQERAIPWKRGWLLYGVPGTGKTALARAFAEDLDMPVFVFNLSEIGNHELMRSWTDMQTHVPCIALIEDIDNVFHGCKNVSMGRREGMMMSMFRRRKSSAPSLYHEDEEDADQGGMLSFDVFLNCLDGIESSEGVFTIVTTNDISKIDEALGKPRKLPDGTSEFISTRPGRIDKAIELSYMLPDDKRLMARRILGMYPQAYEDMLEFIARYPNLEETPAQFQERCAQIAIACFYEETQQDVIPLHGELQKKVHG